MPRAEASRKRCAIYTRKSSDEGLEQEFNSLAAQREACEAYIRSQQHEGWVLARSRYDDGGFSGGNLERPALQQLLADIRAGRIDIMVVYKVDRLTRSLADFARLVEIFDAQGVSFVSVTQQFNTTSSMGRLTLNVLLSFAQFEREVTGERIRDKIAASKTKGMWMGGNVPLGYDASERALVINPVEAETVRRIFALYREHGCVRRVKEEADRLALRTKLSTTVKGAERGGKPFSRGHLYTLLSNPIYTGHIAHKGELHPGQQAALIDDESWSTVRDQLAANTRDHRRRAKAAEPSLLAGLLVDAADRTRSAAGLDRAAQTARKLSRNSGQIGPRPRPHRGRASFATVGTFARWDCVNARQRERANESRFAAGTSLLTSPATRRMPPKCGTFRIQPRGSPLRQTGRWRKANSNCRSQLRVVLPKARPAVGLYHYGSLCALNAKAGRELRSARAPPSQGPPTLLGRKAT